MPEPAIIPGKCQVCGTDTRTAAAPVDVVQHSAAKGDELLAHLCMPCFARALVWAANQSAPMPGASRPDAAALSIQ